MKKILSLCMICLGFRVFAQENTEPQIVQGLNIAEERIKLNLLRNTQEAEYRAAKKACYQKLAVTACLDKAR